ncbi:MAG: XdhC family protein [Anaerolineales bacterium]
MQHPITVQAGYIQDERAAVLATVIKVEGASPAKVGAHIALLSDGTAVGTVGGGK